MIEDIELETLINDIYEYHGFDLGNYSKASLKRRVTRVFQLGNFSNFYEFLSKVKYDADFYKKTIDEITVNVANASKRADEAPGRPEDHQAGHGLQGDHPALRDGAAGAGDDGPPAHRQGA